MHHDSSPVETVNQQHKLPIVTNYYHIIIIINSCYPSEDKGH